MRSNGSANTIHLQYSSVNLASREFKADPFPFYAHLRAEQPVCRVSVPLMPGVNEAWLITRYDDVVAVLKDSRFACDRVRRDRAYCAPEASQSPGAKVSSRHAAGLCRGYFEKVNELIPHFLYGENDASSGSR
jgi:cytochrome P450